jgi:hypothetical protein
MKYQIAGWIALASITFWAAPYVYGIYDLCRW